MTQTRRERVRQMTLDEIKNLSWNMVSQKGIENLTVNGIARQMGMTPPAFYRYYKNRDDLIKTLVIDAYGSFRAALEKARDTIDPARPVLRLYRVFTAYREWAVANPNMFGLFAGRQVYGFTPRDPRVTHEADKVYQIFIDLYLGAWKRKMISRPKAGTDMPLSYKTRLKGLGKDIPVEIIDMGISGACLVHGMISMEISGRLSEVVGNGAGGADFYMYQIKDLMKRQGMNISPE